VASRDGEMGRWHKVICRRDFGGLCAGRTLADAPVSIALIDTRNYHLFRPMLYQVATGLLFADEIAAAPSRARERTPRSWLRTPRIDPPKMKE
jgi:hypothetical protein